MADNTASTSLGRSSAIDKLLPQHREELAGIIREGSTFDQFASRATSLGIQTDPSQLWKEFHASHEAETAAAGEERVHAATENHTGETKSHGHGIAEKVKHFGGGSHHEDEIEEEEEEERLERIKHTNLDALENAKDKTGQAFKDNPEYKKYMQNAYTRAYSKVHPADMMKMQISGELQQRVAAEKRQMQMEFLLQHYDTYDKFEEARQQYNLQEVESEDDKRKNEVSFNNALERITKEQEEENKKQQNNRPSLKQAKKIKQVTKAANNKSTEIYDTEFIRRAGNRLRNNRFTNVFRRKQRLPVEPSAEFTPDEKVYPESAFRQRLSAFRDRVQSGMRNVSNRVRPEVNSAVQRGARAGVERASNGLHGMLRNALGGSEGGPTSLLKGLPRIPGLPGIGGGIGELGEQAAIQGARSGFVAFLAGGGWIILLIILLLLIIIIIIIIIIAGHNAQTNNNNNNKQPISGLTIVLKGPTQINNGTQLAYEVDVSCDQTCQQAGPVMIYEQTLPAGTSFASADGVYDTNPYPITWHLSQNTPTVTNGINNYIFHFTLNTLQPNNDVSNIIYGDLENGSTSYVPVPGLTLNKTAVAHVNNGQNIVYTITANYTGTDTVTLTDQVPDNTKFISATGKYTNSGSTISWVLKDNGSGPNYSFTLTVQPTVNDIYISNTVYGTIPGTGNGSGSNIVWLDSYSPAQFDPHFDAWVWAQCSQASMAEIFNSYKQPTDPQYKIVDLETWAYMNGAPNRIWDPVEGLEFQQGISIEAAHYGFTADYKTYPITDASLDTILGIVKQGHPMMMSAPGHWFVLWGADPDGSQLWIMDSSAHDITWAPNHQVTKVPRSFFLHGGTMTYAGKSFSISPSYWTGIAVELTPQ